MFLMKEHFYQDINETEHLKELVRREVDKFWIDCFLTRHLVLIYYWIMIIYYFCSPTNAYDVNIKIEEHSLNTYTKFLKTHPDDQRIKGIAQDELITLKNLLEPLR